jgi:hypothetical protein
MRRRVVEVELPAPLAATLAEAVSAYAHAAFPDGGSECAQVSRQALLDTARSCATHSGGTLTLRKRQMPQVRAAVEWYFAEADAGLAAQGETLRALLSGTARPAVEPPAQ